jgi:hypothetical protein
MAGRVRYSKRRIASIFMSINIVCMVLNDFVGAFDGGIDKRVR